MKQTVSERDAEFLHIGNLNGATVRGTWTASEHSA